MTEDIVFACLVELMSNSRAFPNPIANPLTSTETHVVSFLLMSRARGAIFGADLFLDHAWDIVLELYAAKLAGRSMLLPEITAALDIRASSAIRWIAALEERGLIEEAVYSERPDSPAYRLTNAGASKLEALADQWATAFIS